MEMKIINVYLPRKMTTGNISLSTLSCEAYIVRCLIRNYIMSKLRINSLIIPASLLTDIHGGDNVAPQDELKEAFANAVDMFTRDNGTALTLLVETLPATVSTIEGCVVESVQDVLTYGAVTWGSMVAVTAFVNLVALRCVRNEMGHVLVPVIDHIAVLADQKLTTFIRDNGSWPAFEYVFKTTINTKRNWMYSGLLAAVNFIKAYI
jgi:hypothetical protein